MTVQRETSAVKGRHSGGSTRWTAEELATVRAALEVEVDRLQRQVLLAEQNLGSHVGDYINDLGDEAVDVSSLMVELNEGSSVASNDKEVLHQTKHALERLDSLQYGSCEVCAHPIARARLIALPRATHCVACRSTIPRD